MTYERPLPYIGISGISEPAPHEYSTQYWLMDQFVYAGLDTHFERFDERQIALGVKAVHKTQYLDIENKYGREWYPVGEGEFKRALNDGGIEALRSAQIYLEPSLVSDVEYRSEFVKRICKRGAAWLNTLQFDMLPWHESEDMFQFVETVKQQTEYQIILQAHSETMQQLGPDGTAKKLGRYAHALDYVLFDASHGKGIRMNPNALKPFLESSYASAELGGVGFGVAGGLNAEVVREELPSLVESFNDISWDAEGKLHNRDRTGVYILDELATRQYLQASSDILSAPKDKKV